MAVIKNDVGLQGSRIAVYAFAGFSCRCLGGTVIHIPQNLITAHGQHSGITRQIFGVDRKRTLIQIVILGTVVRLDVNPGRFFLFKLLGNACFSLFPIQVGRIGFGGYRPLIFIAVGVTRLRQHKLAVNIGNTCFLIDNIHLLTEAVTRLDIIALLYRWSSGIQFWRITAGTQFDFNIA